MKDRISLIIKERKITKTEFAKRLNLSQAFVSQMCSGVARPSDRTIADICREFRVREKWLRNNEGDMDIEDTERDKLQAFFADVLATAPDERSAFVAALADLPDTFWPLVAELARKYADNLKKE
jgi:transcriptional regulator with XRE-family HTH domain